MYFPNVYFSVSSKLCNFICDKVGVVGGEIGDRLAKLPSVDIRQAPTRYMHTNSLGQGTEIRSEIWQLVTSTAESRTNNTEYCFYFLKSLFHISQRAPSLISHATSFHLLLQLSICAQSSPRFALFGSSEYQLVKTTLLPVDSKTQCPSDWRSVMPSQKAIPKSCWLRWIEMALFSSVVSISMRRAGTSCSSQNFLASLCVNLDAWNLRGDGG